MFATIITEGHSLNIFILISFVLSNSSRSFSLLTSSFSVTPVADLEPHL
jgi:hypothetical protein